MINRLEMLRIFVAAAECESFKEAAATLGVSPQVVTRAIKDLEDAVGELLFHRNTRSVRITAYGEAFVDRARAGLEQIESLFLSGRSEQQEVIEGRVRVAAPSELGRRILMPLLAQFARMHRALQFDVRLSDQQANVVDEKIDIGIRVGFPRDNRFVVRPLGVVPLLVVASPALLARYPAPTLVEALHDLPVTASLDPNTGRPWPWLFAGGGQLSFQNPAFLTDDVEAERLAVLEGLGFGQLIGYAVAQDIAAGRLVPVLQECAPEPWPIYLYRPQRGPVPARIRAVFDYLVEQLSAENRQGW